MFKAQKISDGVYWVGALEWNERSIHGISMPYGSTNNAYLIIDEKVTLIDTCERAYAEEMLERISSVIDPSEIEVIVSNHSERDHAGSIERVLEACPNATVITSTKGAAILKAYFGDLGFHPVKTGDTYEIGKRTLHFIQTPMVHWPDNMVTYSPFDKTLFSNDAFGQFISTSKRFDSENDLSLVLACAKQYFANILAPYTKQTARSVEAVKALDIDTIAPAHGVIWRKHIPEIIELYETLCAGEAENKAVVVFDTMYETTQHMADVITEAFIEAGVSVREYDLRVSDLSQIMTDVFTAKYLACGCPTHNHTVLPEMGAFLAYLKGLAPKGRIGISFGAYGWADSAPAEIARALEEAGYTVPLDPLTSAWNTSLEGEEAAFEGICEMVRLT